MDKNRISLQNRLCDGYLRRTVIRDGETMYLEGLRLIEWADYYLSLDKAMDAAVCVFEGLSWIYVSGITKARTSILAADHAASILRRVNGCAHFDLRLDSEQKTQYLLVVNKFFSGYALVEATDILLASSPVSGWNLAVIPPQIG